MTKRRHVSTKERVALFTREGGICHHCGGLVTPGQSWQLSHKIPLALGGADDASNWGVIHTRPCHEFLTRAVDVPAIAKAKRREAEHLGASRPKAKIPAGPSSLSTGKRREPKPSLPPRSLYV